MPVDPEQTQVRMVPGGDGVIYSVRSDGSLLWYRHRDWLNGTFDWANNGNGVAIDDGGWNEFRTVLAAADGQLFGLRGDGTLRWFRHTADKATGQGTWHPRSGSVIGAGFDRYPRVFGGWNGVLYAIDPDGRLFWYRYLAGDGSDGAGAWANGGAGARISDGNWKPIIGYAADPQGVIYGVQRGAVLLWWRYLTGDGTNGPGAWANNGKAVQIGTGWQREQTREWFSNDNGSFYAVFVDRDAPAKNNRDHELYWFRLTNWLDPTAGARWVDDNGRRVGTGWTLERSAALQGYPSTRSVRQGARISFPVSTNFPHYTATVRRMTGPGLDGPVVWGPRTLTGRFQFLRSGYRATGCGWEPDFALDVPTDWRSGFYNATLTGPGELRHHIPFAVRPAEPTAPLAFLLPLLTHNAYDHWGGHNQYSWDEGPWTRQLTLLRPSALVHVDPPGRIDDHYFSDLLLVRWLERHGIAYDCYQDADLHTSGDWLDAYRAVLLGSHPEYWTETMRARVLDFMARGGRVVCVGGNSFYERVNLTEDGTAVIHRARDGARSLFREEGLPEYQVLGTWWDGYTYMTFAPYRVVSDHPFLAGTGLRVGDLFGADGHNMGASGWETDAAPDNQPGVRVIAEGTQGDGGADMVLADRGAGGWAFTVSSLTYAGVLDTDAAASKILLNAVTAAVTR
ncbi:N,N-dimethylformamidase beta subunit family domain-containing protein [Streptoalloteichus hindustanus]|uniref:Tachylectin n=1 Tax=Streptoalloteichus hindustanus TaxID=2017 RepID=A0A1M4VGY6_STRHI|nr:N,N-dimethylformamidase beta subunit family domain-containing protein [Streptoalloteichus hindustanus]SHE68304.1 Tachylectin [Streptoalloteichus hindustanus]